MFDKQNCSIGGYMVKKMIEALEEKTDNRTPQINKTVRERILDGCDLDCPNDCCECNRNK